MLLKALFGFILMSLISKFNLCFSEGLPDLGEYSRSIASQEEELEEGWRAYHWLKENDPDYLNDLEIQYYLKKMSESILKNNDANEKLKFFLIKDSSLNAFALPGGFIGFHTGLIDSVEKEEELAGVMAHEIIHVQQSHLVRRLNEVHQTSGVTAAILLAAILSGKSSQAASGAIYAGIANNIEQQLFYTRQYESEADRLGQHLLRNSQYENCGLKNFLRKLHLYYGESNIPEYMRTHPITPGRLSELENLNFKQVCQNKMSSIDFYLTKIKVTFLAQNKEKLSNLLSKYPKEIKEIGQLYWDALSALSIKKVKDAEIALNKLSLFLIESPYLISLQAAYEILGKLYKSARETLERGRNIFPDNLKLYQLSLDLLIKMNQKNLVKKFIQEEKYNLYSSNLHEINANAYSQIGENQLMHESLAKFYEASHLNKRKEEQEKLIREISSY